MILSNGVFYAEGTAEIDEIRRGICVLGGEAVRLIGEAVRLVEGEAHLVGGSDVASEEEIVPAWKTRREIRL